MSNVKVDLMENGPIIVKGKIELKNSKGEKIPTEETIAFCRCGASKNKPFCDGSHNAVGFKE
jgi:CDGSH-type Zn-finger protein